MNWWRLRRKISGLEKRCLRQTRGRRKTSRQTQSLVKYCVKVVRPNVGGASRPAIVSGWKPDLHTVLSSQLFLVFGSNLAFAFFGYNNFFLTLDKLCVLF